MILDREFFLHDIAASAAHAQGLQHIGILSADELDGLLRELEVLAQDFREGRFVLDTQYEDGHSAIEARLTERLGDAGRKIHTGRSRNDQAPGRTARALAGAVLMAGTVYLVMAMRRPDFNDAAVQPHRDSSMRCRCRASCS